MTDSPSRSLSITSTLASILGLGSLALGLSMSVAGCGGSSSSSHGNVTNAIVVSPIDGAVLSFAIQDRFYRQTVTVTSGGTSPYTFTNVNNALPPGLFLLSTNSSGATIVTATQVDIVGFPNNSGATTATFQVLDANNDRTDPGYTFTINPRVGAAALTLLPPNGTILTTASLNVAYVNTMTLTTGTAPYNWRSVYGGLPPGLTFTPNPAGTNTAQANISGTPTTAGTYVFGIEVDDNSNPQEATGAIYQITVQ